MPLEVHQVEFHPQGGKKGKCKDKGKKGKFDKGKNKQVVKGCTPKAKKERTRPRRRKRIKEEQDLAKEEFAESFRGLDIGLVLVGRLRKG